MKYKQLVIITSELPLSQEEQIKGAIEILKKRLLKYESCSTIKNVINNT